MGALSGIISLLSLAAVAAVNIGGKAPQFIDETQWIKGKAPVIENSITVVELWKTSCSTCRGQIPHLTSLQKSYGNRISIVALSTEPTDVLQQFMKEHGDEIGYTIGHVSQEVASRFFDGRVSIPYSYIIDKKGILLWEGHPATIDDVLGRIVAGSFDLEKSRTITSLKNSLIEAIKSNQFTSVSKAVKDLLAVDPGNEKALEVGMDIAKYNNNPEYLREIFDNVPMSELSASSADKFTLMLISDSDIMYRYPEAALKFADYALKKDPGNSGHMDTYAGLIYSPGDLEKAIEWERKAISVDPDNRTYKDNLEYYLLLKKLRATVE